MIFTRPGRVMPGEKREGMKYIVEDRSTDETIKEFDSEEEREKWIADNCTWIADRCYVTGTEIQIAIYEW